jgi:hypothetical protein
VTGVSERQRKAEKQERRKRKKANFGVPKFNSAKWQTRHLSTLQGEIETLVVSYANDPLGSLVVSWLL